MPRVEWVHGGIAPGVRITGPPPVVSKEHADVVANGLHRNVGHAPGHAWADIGLRPRTGLDRLAIYRLTVYRLPI
jgi:hypothetical protein